MIDGQADYLLSSSSGVEIGVRELPLTDYEQCLLAMQSFTEQRSEQTLDEIWLVEHPPVYTQGTSCQQQPLLNTQIPVVKTDRGGQITYHGPGQIVLYPLLKLARFNIGVKSLVAALEQSVIDVLGQYEIQAERLKDAPGVYCDGSKIAALGLRIRRGASYHGLSFNINMDLSPFGNIDPCGYKGLQVTQLSDLAEVDQAVVTKQLLERFLELI